MTTPATDDRTTAEASPSLKSPPPSSTPRGVRTNPLGVRLTRSTSEASEAPRFPASGSDGPPDPLDDAGPGPTTIPSSGVDAEPLRLDKRPLKDVLRGLALGAGEVLHQRLARTDAEEAEGVWLMKEPQAAGMADPLANIANRHAGATALAPDLNDLIAAGIAVAGYLLANGMRAIQIRRAYRRAGAVRPETPPTEGDSAA